LLEFDMTSYAKALGDRVAAFDTKGHISRSGTVSSVGDGVARVTDLPGRCYGELLRFSDTVWGIALELEENGVGAVLLTAGDTVSIGDMVHGTSHPVDTAISENVLGRVLSPIGSPLDGLPFTAARYAPIEKPAPPIINRRPIDTPLETGILAVDSMVPIGRGQRELIIGDRQTGKTTIAIDTILNQKNTGVICIYCAIGQKASTIAHIVETLEKNGAMGYTTIVASTAADSPAMQYLAPYAACAMGEYFMESGRDVLVVYDDLSKHAVAYRTMSLLLHRPPGREAYPGDVFYLHSRLLERSACLSEKAGGGSMTALPLVETTGGNISAYIPTNVISITDGQIYLESELFHSGIRPAINTGLSVSRVGRAAQYPAMKKVAGMLRIELAQYKEMAIFARFGSDLDAGTRSALERGEKLTAVFRQGKNKPYALSEEILLLLAIKHDIFLPVPTARMGEAIPSLLNWCSENSLPEMVAIDETGDFDDAMEMVLTEIMRDWAVSFTGGPAGNGREKP